MATAYQQASAKQWARREHINQLALTQAVAEARANDIQEKRRLIEEAAEANKEAFIEQM